MLCSLNIHTCICMYIVLWCGTEQAVPEEVRIEREIVVM